VFTRARRDYAVVRAARGVAPADAATASRAQAIKDAQRHVWLQASIDGAWIDLDTAFADSEPKTSYCSPRETVTAMPDAWHQQVTLRVSAERVEDGTLGTTPVLTVTMRAVDLAGEAIFLAHTPHKGSGAMGLSIEAASARGMWTPVMLIGPRVVTGQPIDFSDDGGSGLVDALGGGGSSALVAEWLELEVLRPDGRKDLTRRALFDRAGAAWRASADHDAAKLKPIARNDAGPIAALSLHNVLFSAGPMNLSAYGKAISWVAEQAEDDPEAVIAARLYPFAVANFAALVWTDHFIVPAVNEVAAVRLYVDSPRVVIVTNSIEADGGISETYDLRRDHLCAVALDPAADALVADQKLWFGLLEGALEHESVARDVALGGGDPTSVASTSGALTPEGVQLVTSGDIGTLAALKDPEKTAWLRASVQGGNLVVVPRSSFGNAPLAFWQISPTGDARAVAGDDLNMSSGRVASGGRRAGNPIARPPSQGGKTIFIPDSPGGAKRGKIEYTGGSRAGEDYSMVLQISQVVVVGLTTLAVVQYHLWKKESQAAYDAWNAAEQEKQDRALRAAGVGR
jgi:hypothetical protein